MIFVTDQTNRNVELINFPKKIVSVVPSQTELLAFLNLENEVVGITKFCIHPAKWFKSKNRIGGTKNLNLKKIEALKPDLIIANKEENDKTQIEYLTSKYKTYISNIITFKDALNMILDVGKLTNKTAETENLVLKITDKKAQFDLRKKQNKTAAYLIWNEPKMVAANNTFINQMLQIAGFNNVFEKQTRYPKVTDLALQKANPQVVLLSSEPFPFKEKHIKYYQNLLPNAKVILVDGTYFSWYGNRLENAFDYFEKL